MCVGGRLRCSLICEFQWRVASANSCETDSSPSPVTQWRRRRQRQGFVRVEVQVRKQDAALVRDVVAALVDPEHESETRIILYENFATPRTRGLKALLAAAPLEGIDLERPRDLGRDASRVS